MLHDKTRARCWLEVDTKAVLNNLRVATSLLQNGAQLDCGAERAERFEAKCPDSGRVCVRGEVLRG